MNKLMRLSTLITVLAASSVITACSQTSQKTAVLETPQLLAELSYSFNSPASFTIDAYNNVLFTSPNLHNDLFVKQGLMKKAEAPTVGLIDMNNKVSTWYTFQPQDMEAKSGAVVPMGIAKGPDGNMYIADMQLWVGGESRLLRVNVKEGKATTVDVVAKGFSFPNGIVWKGSDLFISDTVLATEKGKSTISGIYKVNLKELTAKTPLQISSFKNKNDHDRHLIETFDSDGSLGFGANGVTIDDEGNLYTGIMEEGTIFKTVFNENNTVNTTLFVKGLVAPDGIQWDKRTQSLYTTDLFTNSVYRIGLDGKMVLLAQNGNTDGANGELDGPGEVIVRGNQAYINNFDAAFGVPSMVNTKPDTPVTISVINVK